MKNALHKLLHNSIHHYIETITLLQAEINYK